MSIFGLSISHVLPQIGLVLLWKASSIDFMLHRQICFNSIWSTHTAKEPQGLSTAFRPNLLVELDTLSVFYVQFAKPVPCIQKKGSNSWPSWVLYNEQLLFLHLITQTLAATFEAVKIPIELTSSTKGVFLHVGLGVIVTYSWGFCSSLSRHEIWASTECIEIVYLGGLEGGIFIWPSCTPCLHEISMPPHGSGFSNIAALWSFSY